GIIRVVRRDAIKRGDAVNVQINSELAIECYRVGRDIIVRAGKDTYTAAIIADPADSLNVCSDAIAVDYISETERDENSGVGVAAFRVNPVAGVALSDCACDVGADEIARDEVIALRGQIDACGEAINDQAAHGAAARVYLQAAGVGPCARAF